MVVVEIFGQLFSQGFVTLIVMTGGLTDFLYQTH